MALQVADQMIEQNPDFWESYDQKGDILSSVGKHTEARQAYEKAVEVAPDNWKPHSQYGWFLDGQNHFEEAIERFSLAAELDSNQYDPVLGLAWVLRRMGKSSKAGPYQKRAVELGPYSARTHRHYGMYLEYVVGDIDEAVNYYIRAVKLNPRYDWGHESLAHAYAKLGRYAEALQAVDKAIEISPTESYFVLARAGYLAEASRLDSAITAYRSYLDMPLKPNYSFVQRRIADIYVVLRKYAQADSMYSLSISDPDSIQRGWGRFGAVNPLMYQGRFSDALDQLQKGIEIDQTELGNSEPLLDKYNRRGWIFLRYLDAPDSALAQFMEAEKVLDTLPSKTRNMLAWIKGAQAVSMAAAGEVQKARQILEESLEKIDRTEADLRRIYNGHLADIFWLAGEYNESVRQLKSICNEEPEFNSYFYLGVSYFGANHIDESVAMLEKAVARYDDSRFNSWGESVLCHYYLGQAYETAGRTNKAIEQYETFLDIWKNADEGLKSVEDATERLARLKNKS
jgi:tetratricopeptide (TPR) repeat protein